MVNKAVLCDETGEEGVDSSGAIRAVVEWVPRVELVVGEINEVES